MIFIVAAYNYIAHVVDAPTVEVHALREGLLLAQHIGCSRIIIQSDCLEVAETMNKVDSQQQPVRQYMTNVRCFGRLFLQFLLSIVVDMLIE
jgi:hypothetical protein